jgi:xanthine dehydrogenase molybdopterin-binding subunit B
MIMEHIAHVLKKDPLEVRMANMMKSGDALLADPEYFQAENPLPQIIQDLQNSANYKDRKRFADNFNEVKPYDKKKFTSVITALLRYIEQIPFFNRRIDSGSADCILCP